MGFITTQNFIEVWKKFSSHPAKDTPYLKTDLPVNILRCLANACSKMLADVQTVKQNVVT